MIFFVSSIPNVNTSFKNLPWDKLLHFLEYLGVGFLFARALGNTPQDHWPGQMILLSTVLFSFFYGLTDEFHQSFVAGREFSLGDLLADTLGGFVGGRIYKK